MQSRFHYQNCQQVFVTCIRIINRGIESLRRRSLIEKTPSRYWKSTTDVAALLVLQQPGYMVCYQPIYQTGLWRDLGSIKLRKLRKLNSLETMLWSTLRSKMNRLRNFKCASSLPSQSPVMYDFRDEDWLKSSWLSSIYAARKSLLAVGYARENVQNLLLEIKADLSNHDFSYTV